VESEYKEDFVAFMVGRHLRMLLTELMNHIYFDSKSKIAMGKFYKLSKNTRHILWHKKIMLGKESSQMDLPIIGLIVRFKSQTVKPRITLD